MIQLHGTKVTISREGVQSVWETYYVNRFSEIENVPQTASSAAGVGSLALVEISAQQAEEGDQYVVTAKYEGIANSNFVKPSYAWQPEEKETDIILNPNIKELWVRYKAEWDNDLQDIRWPKEIPAAKGGNSVENPMLGVKSFADLFGTWTETSVVAEIPNDLMSDVWSIVDSVPGNFPTPRNRFWLTMPPEVSQRGACYEIKRIWRLSGVMTPERLEASRLIYKPL